MVKVICKDYGFNCDFMCDGDLDSVVTDFGKHCTQEHGIEMPKDIKYQELAQNNLPPIELLNFEKNNEIGLLALRISKEAASPSIAAFTKSIGFNVSVSVFTLGSTSRPKGSSLSKSANSDSFSTTSLFTIPFAFFGSSTCSHIATLCPAFNSLCKYCSNE